MWLTRGSGVVVGVLCGCQVSSLRVVVCPKNLMIVGAAAAAGQGGEAGKKQGTGEEEEAIKVRGVLR